MAEERKNVEEAIGRARRNVGETIDAIDDRIRSHVDIRKFAGEHTPQIVIASTAVGFLLGFSAPRAFTRILHIGVPVVLAYGIIRSARERADQALHEFASASREEARETLEESPEIPSPTSEELVRH